MVRFRAVASDVFPPRPTVALSPNQFRWDPLPLPTEPTDFLDGLLPVAVNGSPGHHDGCTLYLYAADQPMRNRFFYSADGELLIVPQQGTLTLDTELGRLEVEPRQIAVIPRGLRFRVDLPAGAARGYVCENFGAPFRLPDLGPIGSNGLANPRDFQAPVGALRRSRGRVRTGRQISRPPVVGAAGSLDAGRGCLARQSRAIPLRSAPLQCDGLGVVRPSGPVDLSGAALAERHPRHR